MIDPDRLLAAYERARLDLLAEREPAGHWVGELSASALSTATTVSALALVERRRTAGAAARLTDEAGRSRLGQLILGGIRWLAQRQNADGGWGDTDKSRSNIATTMLAMAAFHLTGVPAEHADLLERAERYVDARGGIGGLRRRYGKDKTFAVPILANCALAEMIPWHKVPALPFELACLPQRFFRCLRLPVVSYAIPALVAIGQARYFHRRPLNPITRWIRAAAIEKSLEVLARMQPAGGGYLEAAPLTSFVVMSLAATGRADHPVVRRGVEFLAESVRSDGSWPIDTDLATWNTTLATVALAGAGEDVVEWTNLDWLLDCQQREEHPMTGAAPGGWGWSDRSGAVPDADDTAGALLALGAWLDSASCRDADRPRIGRAAQAGARWLLDVQNADGGWPTFCRGWGKLPFDRSGADLTAHAIRALARWGAGQSVPETDPAVEKGFRYLAGVQQSDGSWVPLWFGNQDRLREENPVYGTAKVLLAYRDLGRAGSPSARRGLAWLAAAQNKDGGWGGAGREADRTESAREGNESGVEETALAVEAILAAGEDADLQMVAAKGLDWLVRAVESGRHRENRPIGFYFAKLWYHERLYPLTFTVSALGQALRRNSPQPERKPAAHLPQA